MTIYDNEVREAWVTVGGYINEYYYKNGQGYPLTFVGSFRNTIVYGNTAHCPHYRPNQGTYVYLPFVVNGVNIKLHTCMYKE